jgi:peptidyl-prolyl cis-trans isomerase A (cyclophilin A)
MKCHRQLIAVVALLASIGAAAQAQSPAPERVRVTTNLGAFVIEVQRDRAPLTAENFINYVKQGFYTNTLFHRVIANFLIQGGGVTADFKPKPTFKPIPNEAGNGLKNLRGTVGLARAAGPHSGDSQIFINVADNADLDPLPTRWGYAVFGKVIEGMDVVDRISVSPTGAMGPFKQDSPLRPVIIEKVELIVAATPPTNPPAGTTVTPATPESTPTPPPATPPGERPAATPPGETPANAPPPN